MTRQDALNWLYSENGAVIDFDGRYGAQCVDYFNQYYQFLVGHSPYADGYGVPGAKDLWNVPTDRFTKIPNNPNDPNQLPQTGDILVYNSTWGSGYGHVEMVLSADQNGVNVSAQNSKGQYVATEFRPWSRVVRGLIGWMSFNGFTPEPVATVPPAPEPTPIIVNDPLPPVIPEVPNVPEPTPTPAPVETPPVVEAPAPELPPAPNPGMPKPKVPKPTVEGLKEAARVAFLAGAGVVWYSLQTGTFSWKVTLVAAGIAALKGVDKWVHENPNVALKGLLPF